MDGDCIVLVDLQNRALPIDHTLILPNTGGVYSSCTLTAVGAYTSNLSQPEMTHNTLAASSPPSSIQHGVFYNECAGACTPVGLYLSYKSNLLQDLPGLHNHFIYQGTPNDNVIAGADVTDNTCWGCALFAGAGPANGTPYNLPLSVEQNIPGAGDVNVNLAFADPTRNVHTWAALKGQAASFSGMWTALAQDPASRLDDLLNYLRAGFAPRNLLLAAAAHDGTYIGAVQPILMFGVINQ